jgi:hypothetical protein
MGTSPAAKTFIMAAGAFLVEVSIGLAIILFLIEFVKYFTEDNSSAVFY